MSLRQEGLSFRDIAKRVSRSDRHISHVSVAALFKAAQAEPKQQPLPSALVETVPEPGHRPHPWWWRLPSRVRPVMRER